MIAGRARAEPREPTSGWRAVASHSAARYVIAGGAAFVVDFGLLALLRQVLGWPTWIAAGTAFVLSFAFTYLVQRTFSFSSTSPHGRALVKYGALVAFNTIATAVIVGGLALTPLGWAGGKVVATGVSTIWNYFVYRHWVFSNPTERKEG